MFFESRCEQSLVANACVQVVF